MADLATPSAAEISTVGAGADAPAAASQQASGKPVRPDEAAYKEALAKAEKAVDAATKRVSDLQSRINSSKSGSPKTAPRQKEIRDELAEIRTKQATFKASRSATQDRIKAIDAQLKAKQNEQKNAKAQIPFKSVDEIDKEIKRLEREVESGKMRLVDERKALADVSALRKQRRAFASLDERQNEIDQLKSQIAEIKAESIPAEQKEYQASYERLQKEMDELQADNKSSQKSMKAIFDDLRDARASRDKAFTEKKQLQDTYYTARRQFQSHEREAAKARQEKRVAEQKAYQQKKKSEALQRKLEEASLPAYGDELRACATLIGSMDPESLRKTTATTPGALAATAQRTVDDSGLKGVRLSKKGDDEEAYFVGGGGKKTKRNKKVAEAEPIKGGKVDVSRLWAPGSLEQFTILKLEPPANADQIPAVLQQVKEKEAYFRENQSRKTQENIEAARAEFDAYEAGPGASTPSAPANGTGSDVTPSIATEDKAENDSTRNADEAAKTLAATSLNGA